MGQNMQVDKENKVSKAPFTCADLHTVCKLYIYV